MKNIDQQFSRKFELSKLTIKRIDSWVISLRPQQPTIGSLVLSLERKAERLSFLTDDEGKQLAGAFRVVEAMLDKAFQPEKINYLALMMVDNQVHFHVIPRYSKPVSIAEKFYKDTGYPGPPVLQPLTIDDETLKEIFETLVAYC